MLTNFIKVRVGLSFDPTSAEEWFPGAFRDSQCITEERIRSLIILPLNEAIGLHNWAVHLDLLTHKDGIVDVWVDSDYDYARMCYIIKNCLKDYKLHLLSHRGKIDQRLN